MRRISLFAVVVVLVAACSTASPGGGTVLPGITAHDVVFQVADTGSTQDTQAPPACVDDCAQAGVPYCTPTGKVAMCVIGSDGCKHGGTPDACPAGQTCSSGQCSAGGSVCGDGKCDPGESCASDCGCDAFCGKQAPSGCYCDDQCAQNGDCCLQDGSKPATANKTCSGSTCATCNGSVPKSVCGNGKCETGETAQNCQQDCKPPATCGDGTCSAGETAVSCAADCPCQAKDSFCDPDGASLHFCNSGTGKFVLNGCAKACADIGKTFVQCGPDATDGLSKCLCKKCGDGKCSVGESYATCPADCACTAADESCPSTTTYSQCSSASGKLTLQSCSDNVCMSAGFGKSLGCGTSSDGTLGCLCNKQGCGDGFCQGNETKVSCPADCKSCAGNSECDASEVCAASVAQCDPADGHSYAITLISGTISLPQPGSSWDTGGSAPDPYIEVSLNGTVFCFTTYNDDTFYPVWSATCAKAVTIKSGDTLTVRMWDDDFGADDMIDAGSWQSNLMELLHAGSYSGKLGNGIANVSLSVVAQ